MRILVVGAGVMGLSIAEALAEMIAGRRTAGDCRHWISGRPGAMEDAAPPV